MSELQVEKAEEAAAKNRIKELLYMITPEKTRNDADEFELILEGIIANKGEMREALK